MVDKLIKIDLQVNKLVQPKMYITISEINETITDNVTLYVNRNKKGTLSPFSFTF